MPVQATKTAKPTKTAKRTKTARMRKAAKPAETVKAPRAAGAAAAKPRARKAFAANLRTVVTDASVPKFLAGIDRKSVV